MARQLGSRPFVEGTLKLRTFASLTGLLCFTASFSVASPLSIAGNASFLGGVNGSWTFQYSSDAPGVNLESIVLDLGPTDLRFDSAAGGFGSGSYRDVGGFGGTDVVTGLSGISAMGASLDGGTILTFTFNNFSSGKVFQFSSDVDHPNPTLLSLLSCAGKTGFALISCNLDNISRTATNDARLAAAELVGPNPMAGAKVTFNFGGSGVEGTSVSGVFQPFDLRNGLQSSADVSTPEPASLATLGSGLGLLIALSVRRRRS